LLAACGVPMALAVAKVADDDMNELPPGEVGEIIIKGEQLLQGYWNRPEATEEAFRGGWFHTGDLAVLHPDGYIELTDRSKDVIISGGENIASVEVEKVLAAHPQVLEAAVVAVPDPRWGERPVAFVTTADGEVTERELTEFVRERLAHFKAPDRVYFEALPKTSTGKIQKHVLRAVARART
jgi:fatty-acyl-CoA synthase